ncbi:MAG: CPBP family intramembrane glutamic endopeptidase [Chloroflexota bacterium]|nr:CPBP family intramembrane glutamic endopeptidase [Chloroflexota bacterium]
MRKFMKDKVRPIALTIAFPAAGFLICLLVEMFFKIEVPKLISSIINLVVAAFATFFLFPQVFGIPFGKIKTRDFNKRIGFYLPDSAWKHILLGVILALCTLSGMLIASILTGRYALDFSTITLAQSVFSLNPGFWEEIFYRGILMMILLRLTKSLRRAAAIQVVFFGLGHVKGVDIPAMFEVISVMIIATGFTYAAYKTRSLIAGIVFHYLHDAFLFFVQPPGGVYTGVVEKALLYAILWSMVGLGCLVTKFMAEKFNVCASTDLYTLENV